VRFPKLKLPKRKKIFTVGVAFTFIAIGYIAYRGIVMLGPNGLGSVFKTKTAAIQIGCLTGEEASETIANPPQTIPATYQHYLAGQPSIGGNLVANPAMDALDTVAAAPQNYFRTIEAAGLSYALSFDEANQPYLHLDQTTPKDVGAAWVTDTVGVIPFSTAQLLLPMLPSS